jgi:predicted ester cyclase
MDRLAPKAVVHRYYEEVGNRRQLAAADDIIAPQFRLFPDSEPPYGPEGVKGFIEWLCITTFPDMHVTIEHLIAEGEWVAAGVTLHATQTAPVDWIDGADIIAPTGRRFTLKEHVFWRVVDGKIVERHLVIDTWGMLKQLRGSGRVGDDAQAGGDHSIPYQA